MESVGSGDEGTIKGQGHQGGGANGEPFADGGGGVSGSVQGVGSVSDVLSELAHFGDTTSIVTDRTIGIDGQSNGEVAQHSQSGQGNTEHSKEFVAQIGGNSNAEDWDHSAHVTKSQTVDDVGGGAGVAGFSDFSDWGVRVAGHDLSERTDDETTPETTDGADPGVVGVVL